MGSDNCNVVLCCLQGPQGVAGPKGYRGDRGTKVLFNDICDTCVIMSHKDDCMMPCRCNLSDGFYFYNITAVYTCLPSYL